MFFVVKKMEESTLTELNYEEEDVESIISDQARRIVLVQHGECEFDLQNKFTGWYDANLTEKGQNQAINAGRVLKSAHYKFDDAFASVLYRTKHTLNIILDEMRRIPNPIQFYNWRLNARHYGALIGHDKDELSYKYGIQQLHEWRYNFDLKPPPMEHRNPYYDIIVNDPIYRDVSRIPNGESMKDSVERLRPYWDKFLSHRYKTGKRIIIVGDESILKCFNTIFKVEVQDLQIPSAGVPYFYELNDDLEAEAPMQLIGNDVY